VKKVRPNKLTARSRNICIRRHFLKHRKQSATAKYEPGRNGRELRGRTAAELDAEIESVVDAAAPDGVTVDGEKLHVTPEGKPEQLNETMELNPYFGVTETEVVPLCPAATVSDDGVSAMEKFCMLTV
jgi:hypothetical protein